MQLLGRRYDTGEPVALEIQEGRVARWELCATVEHAEPSLASRWPWIAPGLVDLQVNGYGGQEFSSAELTPEKVAGIAQVMEGFGVTRFCPTLTTESIEVLCHALRTVARACDQSPQVGRRVAGIHLEGPYITPEDGARGAHPRQHCRTPDWDEFQRLQDAALGRIRLLTMSPEFDGSLEFIQKVVRSGVLVAIGHTAATPARIREAVDAGARMSTHLGNGSHLVLDRHHNYLWAQLAEDRLVASLIGDGHHLPPELVKVFVRAKTPERCVLVSDLSGQAGQAPGRYASPFCDIEILPSGRLVVAGQRALLAGASQPLCAGVANVMRFAGVDLACAVRMAVHQPAATLGIKPGGLAPGDPADLIQFDLLDPADLPLCAGFALRCTVADGQVVSGRPWTPA